MAEDGSLSIKQTRAIAALITCKDVVDAAEKAQVGERSLRRWLAEDEQFQDALKAADAEIINTAMRRLAEAVDSALTVILVIMLQPGNPVSVRLRAALGVLEKLVKLRELNTLEERIAKLEGLLESKRK